MEKGTRISIPAISGFVNSSAAYTKDQYGRVFIDIGISTLDGSHSITDMSTIGILPVGVRPADTRHIIGQANTVQGLQSAIVRITERGEIQAVVTIPASVIWATGCFLSSDYEI